MRVRGTSLLPATDQVILELGAATNISPAEIIRMAVEEGLPKVREKLKEIVASRPKIEGLVIATAASLALAGAVVDASAEQPARAAVKETVALSSLSYASKRRSRRTKSTSPIRPKRVKRKPKEPRVAESPRSRNRVKRFV